MVNLKKEIMKKELIKEIDVTGEVWYYVKINGINHEVTKDYDKAKEIYDAIFQERQMIILESKEI